MTEAAATTDKDKALELAIAALDKQFGKGTIMKLDGEVIPGIERVHSGSLALDEAIGGGYPKGRIVEIYGPASSGKTTLTLHAIAEIQKEGGKAAFIDVEHAFDFNYAKAIGVDIDKLTFSQPDSAEQALTIAETLIESGALDMIVLDSVAALVPQAEIDKEMGGQLPGLQARLMSQACRKLSPKIGRANCIFIFINQIRYKMVMMGNPETTSGGNALGFYSSIRLDIRAREKIAIGTGEDKEIIASEVEVKVVKNKVASPFKVAEMQITYGKGIERGLDLLRAAVKKGVIVRAGAWYSDKDGTRLGQGEPAVARFLEDKTNATYASGVMKAVKGITK